MPRRRTSRRSTPGTYPTRQEIPGKLRTDRASGLAADPRARKADSRIASSMARKTKTPNGRRTLTKTEPRRILTPAEASKDAFDETWERVIGPGMSDALALIPKATAGVPSSVLHFTSASGFEAIVRTRVLRLSRALASNDPLEMEHGL